MPCSTTNVCGSRRPTFNGGVKSLIPGAHASSSRSLKLETCGWKLHLSRSYGSTQIRRMLLRPQHGCAESRQRKTVKVVRASLRGHIVMWLMSGRLALVQEDKRDQHKEYKVVIAEDDACSPRRAITSSSSAITRENWCRLQVIRLRPARPQARAC